MNQFHKHDVEISNDLLDKNRSNSIKSLRQINNLEKKIGRNKDTLIARGALYFNKKDYEKAKFYFALAAQEQYDTRILSCLLKVHSKLDTINETKVYFLEAKEALSRNHTFWQLWGYVYLELKEFNHAVECFRRAKNYNFPNKKLNAEFLIKSLNNADLNDELLIVAEEELKNGNKEEYLIECYVGALISKEKFKEAYDFLNKEDFDWSDSAKLNAFYALCINVVFEDTEKAISFNERAVDLDPGNIQIRWNLALTQLRAGKIMEGIENYKIRFEWKKFPSPRRKFDVPKWDESVNKKSKILIWTEQGLGDDLLFSTAIKDFIKDFPNIIFEHHNKTSDLMRVAFPDIQCREALFRPDLTPIYFDYDYHVPLGDLYLRMLSQNIEILDNGGHLKNKHYLEPDLLRAKYWEFKLPKNRKPKIGFAWTSKKLDEGREKHHTQIKDWVPMLKRKDVDFVSLQYNFDFHDLKELEEDYSKYFFDTGYLDQLDDIEGAVALISNLDLVITSGSAPFILSGALGKETWVYGQYGPFSLGRKGQFFSNPVLPMVKHYTTPESANHQKLIQNFSEKLDNYVSNFHSKNSLK
mgnify:FL=1